MTPDIERLLIEHACAKVIAAYCNAVDDRDIDTVVSLFAREGVLKRPDTGALHGRDAIRRFLKGLPPIPRRHVSTNAVVSVVDAGNATGRSYLTVYSAPGLDAAGIAPLKPAYMIAEYRDVFIHEDGAWRFAVRDTIFVFREDAGP